MGARFINVACGAKMNDNNFPAANDVGSSVYYMCNVTYAHPSYESPSAIKVIGNTLASYETVTKLV